MGILDYIKNRIKLYILLDIEKYSTNMVTIMNQCRDDMKMVLSYCKELLDTYEDINIPEDLEELVQNINDLLIELNQDIINVNAETVQIKTDGGFSMMSIKELWFMKYYYLGLYNKYTSLDALYIINVGSDIEKRLNRRKGKLDGV